MGYLLLLFVWGLGMIPASDRFKNKIAKVEGEDDGKDADEATSDAKDTLYLVSVILWPVLVLVPLCKRLYRMFNELT